MITLSMKNSMYLHHNHHNTFTFLPPSNFRTVPTRRAQSPRVVCEFSSLNSPLKLRSIVGKSLTCVMLNHPLLFHVAVEKELKLLAYHRESAFSHMHQLSSKSDDGALLHRRIAQVKENQCQICVEDVMYLLILNKFSEIRVPMVPKISSCLYNRRLEILPSKDWELESIHTLEILDIIKEHVTNVTGLRANSSVTESWATTEVRHVLLGQVYVASILYGYFLKSVSLRYRLERNLSNNDLRLGHRAALSFNDMCRNGLKDTIFGGSSNMQSTGQGLVKQEEENEDLKCYVMRIHTESLQKCDKFRSKEGVNLVGNYTCALFNNDESGLVENDDVILTSFSSLKRLVLEAVAFGTFLWETEDYIDNLYKLKNN
ncbi:unnamed protein product [Lupinus luteus]|uniref:UV-B-induced protein At3g17800, chloroplastic-like n=1 Tax=Lupinus luteus TaxID=3873 RepID=A0AAV1XRC6_LUPLU